MLLLSFIIRLRTVRYARVINFRQERSIQPILLADVFDFLHNARQLLL